MDAANTYFNKTVLFLATALLMVVPGRAQTFVLNGGSSTAAVSLGNQATGVSVAMSDGSNAAFTTTTAYTGTNQPGPSWLSVTGGLTTPATLSLSVSYTAGMVSGQTYTATVTVTSTANSSVTGTISVSFTFGSASTGGTLTPSQTSVTLSAASGSSTSAQITLANNTGNTVSFSIATPTTTTGGAWLTASASGYTVPATSFATLTIQAPNGLTLASGTYYGTVTIVPTGGGSSTQIGITFTVGAGGGTGILSASPNPIYWTYTTGSGLYPTTQSVTLTSASGASYYTASVSPSNSWLLANGAATTTYGNFTSGSGTILIAPNPSAMSLLTTGATGYVYVTDSNNNPVTITVNLSVNGSGTVTGITWSPTPVTLSAAVGGSTVQQTVYLTSTTAGTFNNVTISGSGLSVGSVTTSNTNQAYVVVSGYSDSLTANTYYGSMVVYFTPTGGSQVYQTIPVSFVVGSGGGITTPGIVTPTSLTFAYQTGTTATSQTLPAQNIVITGTGTFSVSAPTYASGQTGGWLSTSPSSGTGPATVSVSASPTGLAASATPYTATLVVTTAYGSSTVTVSFLVTTSPVLVAYPGSLNFSYVAGGSPPYSPLFLSASDSSAIAVSASTSATWLSVGGQSSTTTPTPVGVQGNNLTTLANGVYTGSVTVTATTAGSAANSPMNIPVVLTVTGSTATGGGGLTPSPSSMTFNAQQNGTIPASQTLTVSASTSTNYTATASSTGNWLSVSPTGSLTTSGNPILTVSVNQSGLTVAGSPYYGNITLVANGVTQTVQVTLVVSTASTGGGTGNVTANPTSMNFGTYQIGGSTPSPQTLQVSSASGSAGVSFTISSNASWLSAGVVNGASLVTPVTFTVTVVNPNVSNLAPGTTYNAAITITPNGGTVVTVPVSLTVQAAPTVTVTSATTLSFSYQVGNANPTPGTVTISGGGASLGFSATVTSGSDWLSVSPTSGTTPTTGTATLTVTVTPGNLTAAQYIGTILISGTGTATGSTVINVNLAVTAPLPTINSVVNAASFIKGAISPGEIITIFGTAIGPATAAYASIDPSTGKLLTTIGGVQVLFNGSPAPMIYASNTQVSAIVPYEMAPFASPTVLVKYLGQTSNGYQLTSATTVPGIFTQNSQGSGPGAILNQDFSVNGPGNPAAKGSTVMVYLTGEGQTSPASVTGKITTATLPPPQVTPAPLLPVGVLINGLPATWTYAGEAPSLAAGLMQLNVQIPSTAQSGVPNSIIVSIGGNFSQTGVTVSVR
jgi:uncharacterized protein (TIGR03437 family)